MASKTISLSVEAYERLRRARRTRGESFSQVVMRATWPEVRVTAGEILERLHDEGPWLDESELDRIEQANRADAPPEDKWLDH
jgi:predicted CopG family antitoxin